MNRKPDAGFVAQQAQRMQELMALPALDEDERSELETFIAISIEVMKQTTVSKMREAARVVELRGYLRPLRLTVGAGSVHPAPKSASQNRG